MATSLYPPVMGNPRRVQNTMLSVLTSEDKNEAQP